MKTTIYGLLVLCVVLIAPAYADCGGGGYEPFAAAVETEEVVVFNFDEF